MTPRAVARSDMPDDMHDATIDDAMSPRDVDMAVAVDGFAGVIADDVLAPRSAIKPSKAKPPFALVSDE